MLSLDSRACSVLPVGPILSTAMIRSVVTMVALAFGKPYRVVSECQVQGGYLSWVV
jgi:hypothetical protein